MIDAVVTERKARGPYTNLEDFITRMSDKEVNKRAFEHFIKAGALDSLGGTRKQFMSVYIQIMDNIQHDKKNNMAGQMSLFDIVSEDQKEDFEVKMPDVGEYSKEMKLAFEKEVLGIYISGHPLEEYQEMWHKNITNTTADFLLDEETGEMAVQDGRMATIGGIISEKKIKYTKNERVMAFLQVEDLLGSVEVIVFPGQYERFGKEIAEDNKVFIRGRVSIEEDNAGKLICEQITPFENVARKLWVKFSTKQEYEAHKDELFDALRQSEGKDSVVIYVADPKSMNALPRNWNVNAGEELIERLTALYGEENVKVV